MHGNLGAIEVERMRLGTDERPRPPDSRPEREPPEPSPPPSPDEEEEDGDIATPKRDRDDEAP